MYIINNNGITKGYNIFMVTNITFIGELTGS